MGLLRKHVGLIVLICSASDIALISAGTAGVGTVVARASVVLSILRWIGVTYLAYFALSSWRRAFKDESLAAATKSPGSTKQAVVTVLALTFLNPHVYIDTVLLLGSISNQYGDARWYFVLGASLGSLLWFTSLGYGARLMSAWMAHPRTWRILDVTIGVVIAIVAWRLAWLPLPTTK
jgi:L-lysine exporter family protein LysE/ArgO